MDLIRDHEARPLEVKTAADLVYDHLRARIVRNELGPGTPLVLADMAAELGVSTMPVRSALSTLQADGLVRQVRHRGATVAPFELEDLEVIQAVRSGIEGFAARNGAPAMSDDHIAEMVILFERCREIAESGSVDTVLQTQWAMQDACYRAAGRPSLIRLIDEYRLRAERYIRLAVGSRALQQMRFQRDFVRACRRRDGEAARRALCSALEWTVTTLRPVIIEMGKDRE